MTAIRTTLQGVQERQDRLLDAYLANDVPKAAYETKMAALSQERVVLEVQLSELEASAEKASATFEQVRNVFSTCNGVRKGFMKAEDDGKRDYALRVLSNIQVGGLKAQEYQFKFPYDVIAKGPKPTTFSMMLAQWDVTGTFFAS